MKKSFPFITKLCPLKATATSPLLRSPRAHTVEGCLSLYGGDPEAFSGLGLRVTRVPPKRSSIEMTSLLPKRNAGSSNGRR